MRRLWLLFAQTVTIALALYFVVATLRPDWLRRPVPSLVGRAGNTAAVLEAPRAALLSGSYREAAGRAMPAVVNILTSTTSISSAASITWLLVRM
jgi:serine protease DegQ